MSHITRFGLPHIAKALRPTVAETERALHRLDAGVPQVNYDLCWRLAHPLYSGVIPFSAALAAAGRITNPVNRRSNEEVIQVLWSDSQRISYHCHPLRPRPFGIRFDLDIIVKPRMYIVENGQAKIFWLQPWKFFELSEEQMGVLATVIRHAFAIDEFEHADLYLLDTSADKYSRARRPRVFGFADLPLLTDAQLKSAFDRFALAYDAYQQNRRPPPKPPKHPHNDDPDQGTLF